MGADLIGYFAFIPCGKQERRKTFNDHKKALLQAIKDEDELKLKELNVDTREYDERAGWNHNDNNANYTIFNEVEDDLQQTDYKEFEVSYRDLAIHSIVVNRKTVNVLFAGGMSWGDEPEGGAYDFLKRLYNLGFYEAFYKSIEWGDK